MLRQGNFVDNQPPTVCRPPLIDTRPPLIETRPPLLEARPPFHLGVPSNVQNQQLMYQQASPQQPFQQPFGPGGPIQGPPTQFPENRSQFNPGQFGQGLMGPRPMTPRVPEYGPRGPPLLARPMPGPGGPSYNCAPNHHPPMQSPMQQPLPPPMQSSMQQSFQSPPGGILQENHRPPMQGPPPPSLLQQQQQQQQQQQGNPSVRGSLLGTPNMPPGNPPHMLPPSGAGNQPLPPMQGGFPRQQQSMLPPPPNQGPPVPNRPPNVQMPPNQQPSSFENRPLPFENRPLPPPPPPPPSSSSFQEPLYQDRNAYNTRPGVYHPDQMHGGGQFGDTMREQSSNMLPSGHKILINPHFRGTVQPSNDARLAWDGNHQVQPVSHNEQFPSTSSYQSQGPYNSQHDPPSQNYQQNYQQNKSNSDDPYAYFSDVWQENRPQKPQNTTPSKHYSSDSNYFREENYSDKYKSDSQWDQKNSYQEDHKRSYQSYRDDDLPRRTIRNEHAQRSRTPPSTYRGDNQNHNPRPRPSIAAPSGANRPQKRLSSDREPREVALKRVKPLVNRSQEEQKVEPAEETVAENKDEDPEMQEYRKKMEEQKRLREKILREKENRRKMAAMEKQNEDAKSDSSVAVNENTQQQETKPVSALMGIVKDGVSTATPRAAVKGRGRPINTQSAEATERSSNVRIIRTVPIVQSNDLSDTTTSPKDNKPGEIAQAIQVVQQSNSRRIVIHNPQKVVTTIQKTISNVSKNPGLQQRVSNTQVVHPQRIAQNQSNAFQKSAVATGPKTVTAGQRLMTSKPGGLQKTVINENAAAQRIANMQQNSQRIVLQKSGVQAKRAPEIKTNTVRLENLAASTSEAQIRRMCQAIGTIESVHMGEGNATIVFKTQSAAMVFHKKYQRKMLDLSLITVRLMPQSTPDNKVATAVAKTS